MTAAEMELEHSIELEIVMNGKKTTLLTAVEQVIGTSVLLTPIQINDKVVGFPPDCTVNLLYAGEKQVFCWTVFNEINIALNVPDVPILIW